MDVRAVVSNREGRHEATVATGTATRTLAIPPKATGLGSAVNGGELLVLALATCYCNDVYREAARRGIVVESVEVTAEAEFEAEGAAVSNVRYHAHVAARASDDAVIEMMRHTDTVAEIHNSLRSAVPVIAVTLEVMRT